MNTTTSISSMAQDQEHYSVPKQMGCMAGFLHILSSKKLHTKRLTSPGDASISESPPQKTTVVSEELEKPPSSPAVAVLKSPSPQHKTLQPFPIFDLKEGEKSAWKRKETQRLSLDSRAAYDAKGGLHRKEIRADRIMLPDNPSAAAGEANDGENQRARSSTSVIAKLMGFEPLQQTELESEKPPQLRRSSSESRVSRDLFQHRLIDESLNFQQKHSIQSEKLNVVDPIGKISHRNVKLEPKGSNKRPSTSTSSSSSSWRLPHHRKSFFEAAEIFPEPASKQTTSSGYGEKERRLVKRGIDETTNDLETLKNILEAWQLKGLLHSNRQQFSHRNIVYDPITNESPNFSRRRGGGGAQRPSSVSPRRERNVKSPTRARGSISPTRSEGNVRRSNNIVKPKSLTVETSQRVNESKSTERRGMNINPSSPRASPRRSRPDPSPANPPPRNRKKPTAEIRQKEKITTVVVEDEACSSISGSTLSTSSEISKMEENKEGRSLLERCGKLLNSIAEMNGRDQQTSPVSVLDSSFYESASPSPIKKRSIDLQDASGELLEEDTWNQLTLSSQSKFEDNADSELYCDDDLVYISDILRSSHYLPGDSDTFLLLEKQQCFKGKDTSQVSRLHRRLIFDIVNEILEPNRKLPAFSSRKDHIIKGGSSIQQIWSEFVKMREHECYGDDLVDIICGVLRKDLSTSRDAMNGWGECRTEFSEVVLDIERMIFRDLVGETIRDFGSLVYQSTDLVVSRRKLVF